MLVQEFFPDIFSEGEYSFVFFDGKFSHAVVKKLKSDFRIHLHWGGECGVPHIQQAQNVLDSMNDKPLYARVDAVLRNEMLYLWI